MKKTAIVTGSSRGIGFAIAKQLGLDGYNIVMVATGPQEKNQAALDELNPKLTDLKHIRYNYDVLERDSAPNSHQHATPKDHHFDEHAVHHDDESR